MSRPSLQYLLLPLEHAVPWLPMSFTLEVDNPQLTRNVPDNRKERVQFDKITARVSRLCYGLDAEHVDAAAITQKVISGVYQGVTTIELDNLVSLNQASDWTLTAKRSYRPQRRLHT